VRESEAIFGTIGKNLFKGTREEDWARRERKRKKEDCSFLCMCFLMSTDYLSSTCDHLVPPVVR
jgi:hypothetical protein